MPRTVLVSWFTTLLLTAPLLTLGATAARAQPLHGIRPQGKSPPTDSLCSPNLLVFLLARLIPEPICAIGLKKSHSRRNNYAAGSFRKSNTGNAA